MILTPQLRQRIEMLQMTTVELSELIQQEMVENPVLEEVLTDEEFQEISEKILDQNSTGQEDTYENGHDKDFDFSTDLEQAESFTPEKPSENGFEENNSQDSVGGEEYSEYKSDSFE